MYKLIYLVAAIESYHLNLICLALLNQQNGRSGGNVFPAFELLLNWTKRQTIC